MTINLKLPSFLTKALLPLLEISLSHEDPARIINMGSVDGFHVNYLPTFSLRPSQAGLLHLTRALTTHLASRHINVNAIATGLFPSKMPAHTLETADDEVAEMVRRKRVGEAADMAGAGIYLSSKGGRYVAGTILSVDDGLTGTL